MAISRATISLATLALLLGSSIAYAQSEQKPSSLTRNVKDRALMAGDAAAEKSQAARPSQEKKLSMCLETWDAQTHMTKREWRIACARSVRDYPDAFDR